LDDVEVKEKYQIEIPTSEIPDEFWH
jgi:hypothetical protein